MSADGRVGLTEALEVLREVIEETAPEERAEPRTIVLVGGTALAAHHIRDLSEDIDAFLPVVSLDAVQRVEARWRERLGRGFKVDLTPTENLWGDIMLRDILQAPVHGTLVAGGEIYEVRALSAEDLYILKIAAGRSKDRDDLALIAEKTTAPAIISRFNTVLRWHGEPRKVPGLAFSLVERLHRDFGTEPRMTVDALALPAGIKDMLIESFNPDADPMAGGGSDDSHEEP